ncbi:MAG: hypothetical protein WAW29_03225 [Streptococcus infantarius]|uniref:BovI n=1 Tax=Streptococcus equinus TaxID=1335 RepID=S5MKN7_STREI|nr:BovI [Streptococcus equinus]
MKKYIPLICFLLFIIFLGITVRAFLADKTLMVADGLLSIVFFISFLITRKKL